MNNISYTSLDDDKLVQMYNDPDITVKKIQNHFDISSGVVYRHLKAQGIDSNRKTSLPWTDKEEKQLIAAHDEKLTGAELCERIPTRTPAAIKSYGQKLRVLKLIGNQKVYKV